ncbi:MAG: hypothetical protein GY847_04920 [Proteobacteria bacterium]|nr:hypothetical protein [Pseudomonadota bacterium]
MTKTSPKNKEDKTDRRVYDEDILKSHLALQTTAVKIGAPLTSVYYVIQVALDSCWQNWVLLLSFLSAVVVWVFCLGLTKKGRLESSIIGFSATIIGFETLVLFILQGISETVILANMIVIIYSSLISRRILLYNAAGTFASFAIHCIVQRFDLYEMKVMSPNHQLLMLLMFSAMLLSIIALILDRSHVLQANQLDSIKKLNSEQKKIINTAGRMGGMLNNVVDHIHNASKTVASRINEQAVAIEEIDTIMDKIKGIAGETALSAVDTREVSTKIREKSKSGSKQLRAMEQNFVEVVMANDVVQFEFADLASKAASIGDILAVNREITGQISILAINAAIQAAKAGRYGSGFRVVAKELKAMIQRTEESLNDIRSLLEYIHNQAQQSADRIEANSKLMHKQLEELNTTGNLFEEISKAFVNTTERIDRISNSAMEQQTRLDEVSIGVSNINEAASGLHSSTQHLVDNVGEISSSHDALWELLSSIEKINEKKLSE